MSTEGEPGWAWWASSDEEIYSVGPCDSREQVIAEATDSELGMDDDGGALRFHIMEARHDSRQIASFIDVDDMVERWIDNDCGDLSNQDGEDHPFEAIKQEQWDDLQVRLRAAASEWQDAHAIVINSWRFTKTRNGENIEVRLPSEEDVPTPIPADTQEQPK